MSRVKVIVKRLNAIQNFGAMNVLCTDKTGIVDAGPHHPEAPSRHPGRGVRSACCNTPISTAIFSRACGIFSTLMRFWNTSTCTVSSGSTPVLPRSTRFRSTSAEAAFGRGGARRQARLICKGAVEEIFAVCTRYEVDGTTGVLDESHFATAKEETTALNMDGFRSWPSPTRT